MFPGLGEQSISAIRDIQGETSALPLAAADNEASGQDNAGEMDWEDVPLPEQENDVFTYAARELMDERLRLLIFTCLNAIY